MALRFTPNGSEALSFISPAQYPYKPLSNAEVQRLYFSYKENGDVRMKEAILKANMRKIMALCKRFVRENGVPAEDLMQEACSGFSNGIDKYNYDKALTARGCCNVGSYAMNYAFKAITEHIEKDAFLVRIARSGQRAAKDLVKRYAEAVKEYATDFIPTDALLEDKSKAVRTGAMMVATRQYVDPASRADTDGDDGPKSDKDRSTALRMANLLPEPQKSILFASVADDPDELARLIKKHRLTREIAARMIAGSIMKIRRALAVKDARSVLDPATHRTRAFLPATQVKLF